MKSTQSAWETQKRKSFLSKRSLQPDRLEGGGVSRQRSKKNAGKTAGAARTLALKDIATTRLLAWSDPRSTPREDSAPSKTSRPEGCWGECSTNHAPRRLRSGAVRVIGQAGQCWGRHGCRRVAPSRMGPPQRPATCLPKPHPQPTRPQRRLPIKFNDRDQRAGRVDVPLVKPCKPGSVASHGSPLFRSLIKPEPSSGTSFIRLPADASVNIKAGQPATSACPSVNADCVSNRQRNAIALRRVTTNHR